MYKELSVEPNGSLLRMQKEAIERAKETAAKAQIPPQEKPKYIHKTSPISSIKKRFLGGNSLNIGKIFSNIGKDDLLLIVLLFLLIDDDADEEIIIIVLFLLFVGFNK